MTSEVPTENFRLQAKKFLLTYKTHVPKGELAHFIDTKMKCPCDVKICHETSEDGYRHTHCAVKVPKKPNVTDCRRFDWPVEGEEAIHPNIRLPKDAKHWRAIVKYLDKQDEEVYGDLPIEYSSEEKFVEAVEYVKTCKTWRECLQAPPTVLQTISSKFGFFQNYHQLMGQGRSYKSKYPLSSFKLPAQDLSKALLLTGLSNAGKTQFALAHFNEPLQVKNLDDLLEYQEGRHDGIVFDDMSFTHWQVEYVLAMLTIDEPTSIKCRYRNVRLPVGLPRIFTHNENPFPIPEGPDQVTALNRRLNRVYIDTPTY